MTSFLTNIIGNPFSTPVGQLIEKATDGSEVTENWATYMDICDLINSTEEGPKDAIKAFKKQLSNNVGKNNASVLYTLTVIETCVKNCGHRFHVHVAQRDFIQELVRILTLKVLPPQIVIDRTLGLFQTWADAFQGSEELKEVDKVCKELKEKGFVFPAEDFENAPPIHTPARKVNPPLAGEARQNNVVHAAPVAADTRGFYIDSNQLAKLKSELDVVLQNCKIFNELLTENTPGKETEEDWKLMMDLNATSKECHSRLVELVGKYAIENLTIDILPVNDEVTNVLLRFERYGRMKDGSNVQKNEAETSKDQDGLVCISADSGAIQIGDAVSPDEFSNLFPSLNQHREGVVAFNPFASSHPQTPEKTTPKVIEMEKLTTDMSKTTTITTIPYTNQELLIDTQDHENVMLSASSHEFDQFLASKSPESQSTLPVQHPKADKTEDLFSL